MHPLAPVQFDVTPKLTAASRTGYFLDSLQVIVWMRQYYVVKFFPCCTFGDAIASVCYLHTATPLLLPLEREINPITFTSDPGRSRFINSWTSVVLRCPTGALHLLDTLLRASARPCLKVLMAFFTPCLKRRSFLDCNPERPPIRDVLNYIIHQLVYDPCPVLYFEVPGERGILPDQH